MNIYKKMASLCFVICIMAEMLTGCGDGAAMGSRFQDEDKLSVVTSIYPMYDFVSKNAGEKAEIINLVPAGTEPHDFELSTGDMQLLEQADMFIYNGADMEPFADKTIQALSNPNLTVVEAASGVELIKEDGHSDPHTWLSVENTIAECGVIKDALIQVDGENADYYTDNYNAYVEQLKELDETFREGLKDISKDTIVVAHQAFGYLCEEYGLKQEAVEGLTADSEPDSARMKELIDFCKKEDIHVIFFEELVSPKVAQTIANEADAETMVLNPIEGITAEQEKEGTDYISLMKENLKALQKALK